MVTFEQSEGGPSDDTIRRKAVKMCDDENNEDEKEVRPSMAMAPAWQAYRQARDAFNDPTCSEAGDKAEYDAREAELSRTWDDVWNASVRTDRDIIPAVVFAKDLLDDGQDEMCSEVLDEVLNYHQRLPNK